MRNKGTKWGVVWGEACHSWERLLGRRMLKAAGAPSRVPFWPGRRGLVLNQKDILMRWGKLSRWGRVDQEKKKSINPGQGRWRGSRSQKATGQELWGWRTSRRHCLQGSPAKEMQCSLLYTASTELLNLSDGLIYYIKPRDIAREVHPFFYRGNVEKGMSQVILCFPS